MEMSSWLSGLAMYSWRAVRPPDVSAYSSLTWSEVMDIINRGRFLKNRTLGRRSNVIEFKSLTIGKCSVLC